MRNLRLTSSALVVALALVACGSDDGDGGGPDARRIDAPTVDAPTVDASNIDAPNIDAAMPDVTTVWVFGDIVENNTQQLGSFTHPATPPVTLTFVPAAGEMPFQNFPVPFSVSADGTRVAYISRALPADPWKLSIADADGSNVVDIFTAPLPVTALSDVSLSPDKTKVAFRADLALAGQFDIYVAPVQAGATPVKVSPDRTNNALDAQAFLSWSPDSRYLAFGGEFTTDNLNEILIRDTTANTTATALAAAQILAADNPRGLLLAPQWGPGNKLFAAARITAAGERQIYTASADGTGFAVLANSVLTRGDQTMSQANNFALSPDGNTIVFAADGVVATAFELYSMPSTGAAAPTRLTSGTITAGRGVDVFRPMRYSPDGTMVAFGADYGVTDDKFQPHVITVAGGALRRLATIADDADAARDVQNMAWTGDSAFLYAIADAGAADNDFQLYALDATMTDQATTALVAPPASGDAFEVVTRW